MRYRDVLTIQQQVKTTDAYTRQRVDTWETFQTIRGNIADASAGERVITDANRDVLISHNVTIPSNSRTRQITPSMRILSGGVTYNIEASTDETNRRRRLVLQVTQVINAR